MFKRLMGSTCRFVRRLLTNAGTSVCTCDLKDNAEGLMSLHPMCNPLSEKEKLQQQFNDFTKKGDDPEKVIEHFGHLRNEVDPLEGTGEIQPNSVKSLKV